MTSGDNSRFAQFSLNHVAYVVTLLACGLATFEVEGLVLATLICAFWGFVFFSRSRPRAVASICVLVVFAYGVLGALSLAMGYSPRSAVHRMTCSNNLKHIALALHNYHDTYGSLPPAYLADANGKPMHSWRVLVLPFLDEEKLYKQYSFEEPWDGPNNRKLLDRMPPIFACPSAVAQRQPAHNTSYVAVVAPTTAWPGPLPSSFNQIHDGTANTVLLIEHFNSSIPWLEPRDLNLDDALATLAPGDADFVGNHRRETFFYEYAGGRQVALVDGSVRWVNKGVGRNIWAALLGRDDGVPWSDDDLMVPDLIQRRLRIGNCFRLTLFVFVALFPLPWVWLNPTAERRTSAAVRN